MHVCGMPWEVATKKLVKQQKHKNVMKELSVPKTDKVLLFIKWQGYITPWVHNLKQRQLMLLRKVCIEKKSSK